MKKLLIGSLLAFSLIAMVGCSSGTSDAPKSTTSEKSAKCGEGKCGGDKKEAKKCGDGKCGGSK